MGLELLFLSRLAEFRPVTSDFLRICLDTSRAPLREDIAELEILLVVSNGLLVMAESRVRISPENLLDGNDLEPEGESTFPEP